MTDNDPKETEGSGGGDGGGETPPPGKDQENGYDIREDVDQKLKNLFTGFDADEDVFNLPADDEDVVDLPADDEDVVDLPADDEDVVDLPADDEDVVDLPGDDADVVDLPADDADVVDLPGDDADVVDLPGDDADVVDLPGDDADVVDLPGDDEDVVDLPAADEDVVDVPADEPKKGAGVSLSPANLKLKAAIKGHPPLKSFMAQEASSQLPSKVSSPPAAPKPRKSLTRRILVWGAVLIIITGTARYLVTYSSQELPTTLTGKTGLLFHKIVPIPAPAAGRPQATLRPKVSAPAAKPTGRPQATPRPKVSAPAAKSTGRPQATPRPKVSASAAKSTRTVKAYVPQVYPYAIHSASFKTSAKAREKLVYYHRGFQAYIVRVDLGKKGVWYRLFFGHFPTATSAVNAIKKYHFTGALISRTRYACLMGSYPAVAQANAVTRRLAGKGFFPYTIVIGDTYHVFVGAHPTRAAAEALLMDLSAAGFSSDLIKR